MAAEIARASLSDAAAGSGRLQRIASKTKCMRTEALLQYTGRADRWFPRQTAAPGYERAGTYGRLSFGDFTAYAGC